MKLLSSAFADGEMIPDKYSRYHDNMSPPLRWEEVPPHTQSFVLIMDDPDAPMGTWDHWILLNLPPHVRELIEQVETLPAEVKVGQNSWQENQYGGPQPPDKMHRYFFKLYALDTTLELEHGATKQAVITAMDNHIMAEATLMGRYDVPSGVSSG